MGNVKRNSSFFCVYIYKFYKVPSLCDKLFKHFLSLILTIFNRCVCKNYTPKVQYWQFCPTLSEQSLADFCRSKNKNKNKTKMFGNFFSLGFWKNNNDTTSGTFVMVRPVLMQNTRQCGRTIIWHRFHVGNAPSKIHLS